MSPSRFYLGWAGSTVLAGTIAVATVSLLNAESAAAILLVAVLEGCCLALVQVGLLRTRLPGIDVGWLYTTVAGMVLGRGFQFVLESGPLMWLSYRLPSTAQLGLAAAAGIVIGGLMALPQSFVLRNRIRHAELWIVARAAGTAAAFAWLLAAQHALGALETGPAAALTIVLAVFAVAAAAAGAIEAVVLYRLLATARGTATASPAMPGGAVPPRP